MATFIRNFNKLEIFSDVTKRQTFPDIAKKVESIVGPNGLNVFLSNAGVAVADKYTPFPKMTEEDYQLLFNTNTMGPIFLIQVRTPFWCSSVQQWVSLLSRRHYFPLTI